MTAVGPMGYPRVPKETSQTDTHGIGSARSLRLKSASQKKQSQYCDTALMRHTFRNDWLTQFGMWKKLHESETKPR